MRLRHQNGQIHTAPHAQLGAVTNYSRDWTTVKFNLKLARDADIEMVRKTAKQIGAEMAADPEYGPMFLQPFKMHSVVDGLETGIVCRFKFTALPGNPSVLQRDILKRLLKRFAEKGVQFASNAVMVQGGADEHVRAAVAASATSANAAAARPVPAA